MNDFRREWLMCEQSCAYFIHNYVYIYDATAAEWIPFKLWKGQLDALNTILNNRLVIILKARQLGMTWLVLAFILWLSLFHPAIAALVFSRREDEVKYLLDRLRGMYKRLPKWMQAKKVLASNTEMWQLSNGSVVYGFPTTAGDSYTATIAVVDEADLVPDLDRLMNAVKPTIDGGGRMILLSRSNKDTPASPFKNMYKAAKAGKSPWVSFFLPWYTRPGRTKEWYEEQKQDILGRTGSLDDLYQQYPATDAEALMARTLDKRLPPQWLSQCYEEMEPLGDVADAPYIPELAIYKPPIWGRPYTIGADPAEGNPTSDDSSLTIVDDLTGEEVASLGFPIEPTTFAGYIAQLAFYYNNARVMVERNNHGHAVIRILQEVYPNVVLENGWDGDPGWSTTGRSKALLWTTFAEVIKNRLTTIHSQKTYLQLSSIEGGTLKAPQGEHDDFALSYALAIQAISGDPGQSVAYSYTEKQIKKGRR